MARLQIGLKQANRLGRMAYPERLEFIAEGLPHILESARGFWNSSRLIQKNHPREAEVLKGFASEEAAKILILLDLVRCPAPLSASKVGPMVKWFYDHLARNIYSDAVSWKPMHLAQLREYVDQHRKAHYLEGGMGEYIVPNWNLMQRESQLYVDIEAYEDDVVQWSVPTGYESHFPEFVPPALRLTEALAALGALSAGGIKATAEIYGQLEFKDRESHHDATKLSEKLLHRLVDEKLHLDTATDDHAGEFYRSWQIPMYNLDFKIIDVPFDELARERDAILWSEMGV